MTIRKIEARERTNTAHRAAIHGAQRRTLEAIFRHPAASNLEWMDVVELVREIGSMHERGNGQYDVHVGGKHHLMPKPHTKDLTGSEVVDLRHFLQEAGWSPEAPSEATAHPEAAPPILVLVMDHHGARIYRMDPASGDDSRHEIHPYDPHRLLHHLAHREKSDENSKHETEQMAFYDRVAHAVAAGGRIMVLVHGDGKGDDVLSLADYLRKHHRETYQRVVGTLTTDLSNITQPQVLALAEQLLSPAM